VNNDQFQRRIYDSIADILGSWLAARTLRHELSSLTQQNEARL